MRFQYLDFLLCVCIFMLRDDHAACTGSIQYIDLLSCVCTSLRPGSDVACTDSFKICPRLTTETFYCRQISVRQGTLSVFLQFNLVLVYRQQHTHGSFTRLLTNSVKYMPMPLIRFVNLALSVMSSWVLFLIIFCPYRVNDMPIRLLNDPSCRLSVFCLPVEEPVSQRLFDS